MIFDKRKQKFLEKILPQSYFVHHKSHTEYPKKDSASAEECQQLLAKFPSSVTFTVLKVMIRPEGKYKHSAVSDSKHCTSITNSYRLMLFTVKMAVGRYSLTKRMNR